MTPLALSALVALGGAAGALTRYWVGQGVVHLVGAAAPWATLGVNVVGCALAGLYFAWASQRQDAVGAHALLMVGFLGGLTTFSAFSLDTLSLWLRGEERLAMAYVSANVLFSLAAVAGALWLGRRLS
ncbi:MAG: fluoride efflux transporter CrcB [Xanthomonadales bacterium]|nr:putative fluoride ion transporter CrcB [Xanthomonadales bacterium]MCC6593430.1 fluoride efflux transporter CrcB [Xanthomonadales bacterium]MCE7931317.1 fluoride efflux transporter CrcB [Xanthomonadales bacterium PRO6]